METSSSWLTAFNDAFWRTVETTIAFIPGLLAALVILVLGWLLGRLARNAVRHLAEGVNRLLDGVFLKGTLSTARLSSAMVTLTGEIVFWVILLIAAILASRVAEINVITNGLSWVATHLPSLIAGTIIIVTGYFAGVLVREQFASRARSRGAEQSPSTGRAIQFAIFAAAFVLGLAQVGLDVTLLVGLFIVCAGGLVTGISVAFGFGAKNHVRNIIGARNARRQLSAGLKVRIGGIEGEILEIDATQIVLDTEEGRVMVPARFADDSPITVLTPDQGEA